MSHIIRLFVLLLATASVVTHVCAQTTEWKTNHSQVTTLHAVANGVYWGDRNGAVKRKVGATTTTLQSNGSHFPSSISSTGPAAGGTEAWTECSGSQCRLHLKLPLFNLTLRVAGNPFGVTVKGRQVFWGDNAGVHRMAF